MSKGTVIVVLVLGAVGYYFYKTNFFSKVQAEFDYTPDNVSITAQGQELHDCQLALTNDFTAKLSVLRPNQRVTVSKYDFKQWNNTGLEAISDLGPTIEFKLRCKEGKFDTSQQNRYSMAEKKEKRASDSGEITESNK